jgi:ubiquinone/menaquinone biosynthesis C-methylase UbiE
MGDFWDERAKEDAFYFVDNRLDYRNPDVERFWSDGEADLRRVLELAGVAIQPGDAIVDVGCGLGRLTRAAVTLGAGSVHAIDISKEMLERAQGYNAELDSVTWVQGDGTSLAGIPDGVADGLISHVVFQHIPDPQITLGYIRDMGRVLKPGAWAAFQISNDPKVHRPRRGLLKRRVGRVFGREPKGAEDPAWLGSAVDLEDLRSVANESGLALEAVEGAGTQFCFVRLRRR